MSQYPERYAGLALIPAALTLLYYILPLEFQGNLLFQFLPQLSAYVCLGIWTSQNAHVGARLGLSPLGLRPAWMCGAGVGMLLGVFNSWVILWGVPRLGGDLDFLTETPHAQVPVLFMVPWGILLIAMAVELNFRGFQLGRFLILLNKTPGSPVRQSRTGMKSLIALMGSAVVFSFDPFMVSTFQHLHWIAVWDGMIWGWMWVRMQNLYGIIIAHAIEVVIVYVWVKSALT